MKFSNPQKRSIVYAGNIIHGDPGIRAFQVYILSLFVSPHVAEQGRILELDVHDNIVRCA